MSSGHKYLDFVINNCLFVSPLTIQLTGELKLRLFLYQRKKSCFSFEAKTNIFYCFMIMELAFRSFPLSISGPFSVCSPPCSEGYYWKTLPVSIILLWMVEFPPSYFASCMYLMFLQNCFSYFLLYLTFFWSHLLRWSLMIHPLCHLTSIFYVLLASLLKKKILWNISNALYLSDKFIEVRAQKKVLGFYGYSSVLNSAHRIKLVLLKSYSTDVTYFK